MLDKNLKNEFDSLLPGKSTEAGASRRTALKTALGVGYAATAMPIMAQTAIKTSSEGLTAGETSFEVNGFKVPAYYAAPAGKKNLPVILVIQEIFGVHEYMVDTARRFAKAGYLAIAPELFARQGDPAQYAETAKLIAEVVSKVPDAQVMGDLDGCGEMGRCQRRQYPQSRHHRFLLGWPHHVALCRAKQKCEGGRGLVRPARWPADSADAQASA